MLYFIIPVFNEELNLDELYSSLKKTMPEEQKFFIFVDDRSTDSTVDKIQSLFSNNEVHIITKLENIGPGDSFNRGFEYILEKGYGENDLVITIEADNTSDVNIMEKMVKVSRLGYDLVLASPYAQGGGFEETTFFRKFLSFIANNIFRFIFDVKILTLSSFYRVYDPKLIKKIKDEYGVIIKEPGFICMVEILIKAIRQQAAMIEIPMKLYSGKRKGKSKMKIFSTGITYLKFLLRNRIK